MHYRSAAPPDFGPAGTFSCRTVRLCTFLAFLGFREHVAAGEDASDPYQFGPAMSKGDEGLVPPQVDFGMAFL